MIPLLALILLIASPLACAAPEANAVLEVTGEGLTRLEVEFRSREGKELERYQFEATDGLVVGGVVLPSDVGANYEITAFGSDGIATYSGTGSIPTLQEDDRPIKLTLPPTDQGEEQNDRDGLLVSLSNERLVLESASTGEPNHFTVRLQAFDPRGNILKLDPEEISWDLTDSAHFELLPLEDKFEIVLRPHETFPQTIDNLCDVPPKVVVCIPSLNCRVITVCPDPWVTISAGRWHTCALTKSGAAYCWGANNLGELGAKTSGSCPGAYNGSCSTRPVRVECPASSPCRFTGISAGGTVTVAIDIKGETWWWGRGSPTHVKVGAYWVGKSASFKQVAAGESHGCGLAKPGELFCWGRNRNGEAGAPLPMIDVPDRTPVRVLGPRTFQKVVAGGRHTCAIDITGTEVACWGRDSQNQTSGPNSVRYPAVTGQFYFQQFAGVSSILDVATSQDSSCVTLGNGPVTCWGSLSFLNVNLLGTPDHLTAGDGHVCAISAHQARCMGSNYTGSLGDNTWKDRASPVAVSLPPANYSVISAGDGHTCAVSASGDAYCWGLNFAGQVGNGRYNKGVNVPTLVQMP